MKVGQSVAEIPRFFDFQDGGGRHLGFSKIRNFNDLSPTGGQYASHCQISSKLVTPSNGCGDMAI